VNRKFIVEMAKSGLSEKLNSTKLIGNPDLDFLFARDMASGYRLTESQLIKLLACVSFHTV
jgi:hypothetical protein